MNKIIASFLGSLAAFQLRAKEKDAIKAKSKQRFVVGMKQVTNGIKAGKCRLVFLAPDTETSDIIDDKLSALIAIAREKEVPCVYCLSRRRLAKAANLSMRQAVLGVYNPDGSFDAFKNITSFIAAYENDHVNVNNLAIATQAEAKTETKTKTEAETEERLQDGGALVS